MLAIVSCAPAAPPMPREVVVPELTRHDPKKPAVVEPTYAKASTGKVAALDDHAWPPPRIASEGEWAAFDRTWMHKLEGAPPTFFTTSVRVDGKRKTEIVALDARQIELDMAIGIEGPFPPEEQKLGKWPRAGGMLPREANVATRVVAAFNGGFRFDGGAWGMSIRRREFMPPVKDVASLLMHDDGRLGFGVWGPEMKTPADVRSLRQNLDPLFDDGEVNPRHRPKWGGIKSTGTQIGQRAKRTGICRTSGGHFLYLWGNDLEPTDLGESMKKAGCDFGIHLDMNLYHVGFVFMSWEDASYKNGNSEALNAPAMGITNKRYANSPSPKEFFYATLRTPYSGPIGFRPDAFAQPPPAWMPSVLSKNDDDVRVTFFDARRVHFALVAGHAELDASGKRLVETNAPAPLSGDDVERVLANVRLGIASTPLGLTIDGVVRAPLSGIAASLSIDERGRVALIVPNEIASGKTLAQAPLLFADGKALDAPKDLSMAIGVTAKGDLLIAEKTSPQGTSAQLVESLVHAGCTRVIGPRGASPKLERAGREEIFAGGADSRLFVIADRPQDATYRFDLDEKGAPRWPKVKTPLK